MYIIGVEIILWIPILVAIFHYPTVVKMFNETLTFLGFNTQDTHLSLGDYILLLYFLIGPALQIILFECAKSSMNIFDGGRLLFWLAASLSSVIAAYLYIHGTVLMR